MPPRRRRIIRNSKGIPDIPTIRKAGSLALLLAAGRAGVGSSQEGLCLLGSNKMSIDKGIA
jgi:hypothetical protein